MRKLNWPINKEQAAYLRGRKEENWERCRHSRAETWMYAKLKGKKPRWNRQCLWGYRIFDFWNSKLGCAIEVDGPEHDKGWDAYRDEYNFRRSGLIVLRVPNMDEVAAVRVLALVDKMAASKAEYPWMERREKMGLAGLAKKRRRWLVDLPDDVNVLQDYLDALGADIPYVPPAEQAPPPQFPAKKGKKRSMRRLKRLPPDENTKIVVIKAAPFPDRTEERKAREARIARYEASRNEKSQATKIRRRPAIAHDSPSPLSG